MLGEEGAPHEFGRLYQESTGAAIVEVAHMEIAEPTIGTAIGALRCGRCTARCTAYLLHGVLRT